MECCIQQCTNTTRRSHKTIYRWALRCQQCTERQVAPTNEEIEDHRQRTLTYIKKEKARLIHEYVVKRDLEDSEHLRCITLINKRLHAIE